MGLDRMRSTFRGISVPEAHRCGLFHRLLGGIFWDEDRWPRVLSRTDEDVCRTSQRMKLLVFLSISTNNDLLVRCHS
jgi:hypothetical protein